MSKAKHKPYQWLDGETADRITCLLYTSPSPRD